MDLLRIMNLCKCGCKKECLKTFISGHNLRVQDSTHRFKKGQTSWNKDKKMPLEFGEKVRQRMIGKPSYIRTPEINLKNSLSMKGKPSKRKYRTYENIYGSKDKANVVKTKISNTEKQTIKKNVLNNNHIYVSGHKYFRATKPELKFKEILIKNNLKENKDFKHGKGIYNIEHGYIADFYFPKTNTIVEIDGKYWHNFPDGRIIDHIRNKEMTESGYRVLRIWESEVNQYNEKYIISFIKGEIK